MRISVLISSIVAIAAAGLIAGCTGGQSARPYSLAVQGYPGGGRQVIVKYKCGRCHTIPGIPGANGVFGPPLNFMGRRTMIAGNFPNDPENLVRWIMSPQAMKPQTAMPQLGLTDRDARDAAAYLYTLR